MPNNEFVDYVIDLLAPRYEVSVRKMFGGYGLYIDHKIFAIIAQEELYFKADDKASAFFRQYDSLQFSYEREGKVIKMRYWKVMPEVLENQELLYKWVAASLAA